VRPYDLGVGTKCSRGSISDVTISSCAINFSIEGWFNNMTNLKSLNGTLAFRGSYLNASFATWQAENNWKGFQLLGCTGLNFGSLKEEGGSAVTLGAPSTIDYCEHITCQNYGGEGSRLGDGGEWMRWGMVSGCREIHFPHGFVYAGGANAPNSSKSISVGNVTGYTLPERTIGGYSTTGSSRTYHGVATFAAGTTVAVTCATMDDDDFKVLLTPLADPVGRLWVDTRTTTGFTINNSSSTSISVAWQVVRS